MTTLIKDDNIDRHEKLLYLLMSSVNAFFCAPWCAHEYIITYVRYNA